MEDKKCDSTCGDHHTSPNTLQSPIVAAIGEVTSSLVKITQEKITERVEEAIHRITHNIITALALVLLGLVGFVFTLIGAALWIGTISGFGVWFGLLITGIAIIIITLITALMQKSK